MGREVSLHKDGLSSDDPWNELLLGALFLKLFINGYAVFYIYHTNNIEKEKWVLVIMSENRNMYVVFVYL